MNSMQSIPNYQTQIEGPSGPTYEKISIIVPNPWLDDRLGLAITQLIGVTGFTVEDLIAPVINYVICDVKLSTNPQPLSDENFFNSVNRFIDYHGLITEYLTGEQGYYNQVQLDAMVLQYSQCYTHVVYQLYRMYVNTLMALPLDPWWINKHYKVQDITMSATTGGGYSTLKSNQVRETPTSLERIVIVNVILEPKNIGF